MLSTLLLPLVAASAFPHPNPQPPPALPPAIYRERQARVVKELEGCAATLASQGDAAGVTEDFRQDSDFLWLTGVNEKGGWLVLHPKGKFIKTARKLHHANIVRIYDEGRDTGPNGDRRFFTMQLLEGLTLRKIIQLRREKGQVFTLPEVERAANDALLGRVATPVGAIQIETPVRRRQGERFDFDEAKKIAAWARSRNIGLHLDGARLFLESVYTGQPVKAYTALFDTVYVSLYKYFNAASGAILAAPSHAAASTATRSASTPRTRPTPGATSPWSATIAIRSPAWSSVRTTRPASRAASTPGRTRGPRIWRE